MPYGRMYDNRLRVHNLPADVDETELADSTVIVIDLLRATTTMCQALASGASEVVPFREVDEALAAAEKAGGHKVVLGGERGGRRIEGFDLGNSPSEYTPEAVRGRPVFITTTNGTRALFHARLARRVIVGAIVNLSAVAASVKDELCVDILCAGTNGRETHEDILAAGAMASRIREFATADWQTNSAAERAVGEWEALQRSAAAAGRSLSDELAIELRNTMGGRNLIEVGLERDLANCAQIDRLDIVPELDARTWKLIVPSA